MAERTFTITQTQYEALISLARDGTKTAISLKAVSSVIRNIRF